MPRPITVRLPASAHLTLDTVVHRTQRSIAWLLNEAIYDAGHAFALDVSALESHLTTPVGPDSRRTTIHVTEAADAVLASLAASTGQAPAKLVRAAWLHWTSAHDVDEIVEFSGAVRPARDGGAA